MKKGMVFRPWEQQFKCPRAGSIRDGKETRVAGDTSEKQGGEGWYVMAGVWYGDKRNKTGQGGQVCVGVPGILRKEKVKGRSNGGTEERNRHPPLLPTSMTVQWSYQ